MKAELTKTNDTWVTGLELETLTITRSFTYNRIENPKDYYNLDNIKSIFIPNCHRFSFSSKLGENISIHQNRIY
ncbi:MAG: hypothetical protein ACFFFH_18725 [Candidatus Thorarchaeota archaeon]